ncbi:tryptophan halogenase family protein [Ferrimonas balearica]|uniref:tryptophan halogenase family protein n=1 Tax=Ferrimonas balearica TaxID=44012 RepID=UPI001C996A05|nr:tryptophan halogenase family protein [Ferrimonas balearica]MBY5990788.1 tryptophan 7-halogenase [Ferrimonas balearica]
MKQQQVVILGGGSAGWMTAAMLSKTLGPALDLTLVESEAIGTVGVGEASIPPLALFNQALGIDEQAFMAATQGSFKLGIRFEGWGQPGERYLHAFGPIGKDLGLTPFYHYWLRSQSQSGQPLDPTTLWRYSLNSQAAEANKFARLDRVPGTPLGGLVHAYHFDASLYAQYLRRYSEQRGVRRVEGKVERVHLHPVSGDIQALQLADGRRIEGQLFIDCSGLGARLIDGALNTGFDDWSHWLPCDRAWAVPTQNTGPLRPYTRAIAHEAGWQWQIPLQHRSGNGLVFASRYLEEDAAKALLLENLEGTPLAEPRLIRFRVGRRRQQWQRNCIAIGLSSGFLEPLESTSIHLIQSAIMRLVKLFPAQGGDAQALRDEFNRQSQVEFEQIRDFIILHYHLNRRGDAPLWQHCRTMALPDSLAHKLALFQQSGRLVRQQEELFTETAWQQVMLGQGWLPESHSPLAQNLSEAQLEEFLANYRTLVDHAVTQLPTHGDYLAQYCPASKSNTEVPA